MTSILLTDIGQLVQPFDEEGKTRDPVEVITDAAMWIRDGKVVAAGPRATVVPSAPASLVSAQGRAVVPGFVDSHTHIVFAADRVEEMARRARGETYEEIAAAGGGIVRSVAALEACSPDALFEQSLARLRSMVRRGTTTLEVKSGYGLSPALEQKQLDVIDRLAAAGDARVLGTVLAHVIPKDRRADREAYVTGFIDEVIVPAAQREVVKYLDVFVESGAFTPEEARRLVGAGDQHGLRAKLHVDQLHEGGGAALAAELGALSADHLEQTTPEGMRALADAGVVATILPGCAIFLGKGPWPDGRGLREAGCSVAVATDFNPGSSHIGDLALCGTLAATRCGLTLEEALWGITRGGALALGLSDRGTLRSGTLADFAVLEHGDWRRLFYEPGHAPIAEVWIGGRRCA